MPNEFFVGLLLVIITIYAANYSVAHSTPPTATRYLLAVLAGLFLLSGVSTLLDVIAGPASGSSSAGVSVLDAILVFILSAVPGCLSLAVLGDRRFRVGVKHLVGRFGAYDPDSIVHTTGTVLALVYLALIGSTFVLVGGISGLAQSLQDNRDTAVARVIQDALVNILVAALGVGLFTRRHLPTIISRLGLRVPTSDDIVWGVSTGVGLYFVIGAGTYIWTRFTSPETLQAQGAAAAELFRSFDTLLLGTILAVSSATGEEILYRGALQPVYGIVLTSVFFALLHLQYTLTPASLLILVVGYGLGWVRLRQSTSAAIIAHFVYNFIPFLLMSMAG